MREEDERGEGVKCALALSLSVDMFIRLCARLSTCRIACHVHLITVYLVCLSVFLPPSNPTHTRSHTHLDTHTPGLIHTRKCAHTHTHT